MKPTITVSGSKVTIGAFTPGIGELKEIKKATIDLAPYAGRHIRIWLDDDGTYSTDSRRGHLWQIAELDVPVQEHEAIKTKEIDPITKAPVIRMQPKPINIKGSDIGLLELPKAAKIAKQTIKRDSKAPASAIKNRA